MRITIQFRRGSRKNGIWVDGFSAAVLYADKRIILTRGAGTHQTWAGTGRMVHMSYRLQHPVAQRAPKRATDWRVAPSSLDRVKAAL